jgi:pimeloyl-ACP methyl ester carboxylesterase
MVGSELHDTGAISFPGALPPERRRTVDAGGVGIATYEWGPEEAAPLFLVHGGFDFARTFDILAPKLAAGGWRVVAWDQRGHGDSDHTALYSWDADLRDALAVMASVTSRAAPVVGHSKGGGLVVQLADAQPFRVSHLVNLDGLPSRRPVPDVANHDRTRMLAAELGDWLDHRRRAGSAERRPGTIDELARRRARMNPRLSLEWLRYLVTLGARRDADGWRWKIDPTMRFGGFGPWRPEWALLRMPGLGMPFLGVLGLELEEMGWGTRPDDVLPYLPTGARFEVLPDVGHFVHIEQPDLIARLVLDFVGQPG